MLRMRSIGPCSGLTAPTLTCGSKPSAILWDLQSFAWTGCLGVAFYLLYAWCSLTFKYSYSQGQADRTNYIQHGHYGWQLLRSQVCSITAVNARFIYIDDRKVYYMLYYCSACTFTMHLLPAEPGIITYPTIIKGHCSSGDRPCFHCAEDDEDNGHSHPNEIMSNSVLDDCANSAR